MDKILSIQTIKNVFAALGAKTSDDNYGVALLDKTTAEPKGLMEMSDLASVMDGVTTYSYNVTANTETKCFYGGGVFLLWLNNENINPLVFISSTGSNGPQIIKLNTTWFDGNITIIRKGDHYVYITYTSSLTINIKKLI